jgi:hypothetical protein
VGTGQFDGRHKPIPPVELVSSSAAAGTPSPNDPNPATNRKIDQAAQRRKLVAEMRREAGRYREQADASDDAEFARAQRAAAAEVERQASLYEDHLNRADASPAPGWADVRVAPSWPADTGALDDVPKSVTLLKWAGYKQMADDAASSDAATFWHRRAAEEFGRALPKVTATLNKSAAAVGYGGSSGRQAALARYRELEVDPSLDKGVRDAYRALRQRMEAEG